LSEDNRLQLLLFWYVFSIFTIFVHGCIDSLSKKQGTAGCIKAVMKAMKVTFEQKNTTYPDYVISGVKESIKQADEGKLTPYTGIKDMLNLL